MADEKMQIDTSTKEVQRLIEIGPDDEWTPFLEKINAIMLEEKKARQENDSFKGSELCCKIVSTSVPFQSPCSSALHFAELG